MKQQYDAYYKWTLLAGLGVILVLLRLPAYYEPIEMDLSNNALIAHELLQGRLLYTDLWNHKPPLIYLTYAGAEFLVGYGPQAIFLLNILGSLLCMLGVYAATKALYSNRAALWAAGLWVAVSAYVPIQANQPSAELFINICLVWALAFATKNSYKYAVYAGILFLAASLYKQFTIVIPFLFVCVYFLSPQLYTRRQALAVTGIWLGIGIAGWLVVAGYFVLQERLGDFFSAVFEFNRHYAARLRNISAETPAGIWSRIGMFFQYDTLFPAYFKIAPFLLVPAVIGIVSALKNHRGRLLPAYTVGAMLLIVLPGQFFPHYYQLWLPLLSVAGGGGLAWLAGTTGQRSRRLLEVGAGVTVIALLGYWQYPFYRLSPNALSYAKYNSDLFIETERVGLALSGLLKPGEFFYEWGAETGLFFYSQRRPASGIFFLAPFVHDPHPEKYTRRILKDFQIRPPELVLVAHHYGYPPAAAPLMTWIAEHCRPLPATVLQHPRFNFYVRRGGALDARLPM